MQIDAVPAALRERLGTEAAGALVELLDRAHDERTPDVIAACTERFERRLVEEVGSVRVQLAHIEASLRHDIGRVEASLRLDMGNMEAGLRQDMTRMEAGLRQDMTAMGAALRQEMTELSATLRKEIADIGGALRKETVELGATLRQETLEISAGLRQEMATGRFELLKWSFLFWIGQVIAMTGILGVMLRLYRP